MRNLAPTVLGARGWHHFAGQVFWGWSEFKEAVEKEFGLSTADLEARLFSMEMERDEEAYKFVLRVENARRGVNGGDAATLHCYIPRLPAWFGDEVEAVRRTKRTMRGGPLTWADVVDLARDM